MKGSSIVHRGNSLELYTITPVYKTINKISIIDGEKVKTPIDTLWKELYTKKWILKEAITSVDSYITTKKEISTTRCIIYDKFTSTFYSAAHSPEEVIDAISQKSPQKIGFQ